MGREREREKSVAERNIPNKYLLARNCEFNMKQKHIE